MVIQYIAYDFKKSVTEVISNLKRTLKAFATKVITEKFTNYIFD